MPHDPQSRSLPPLALVHDYLNQQGGAERVVDELHTLYPYAPLYTSIYDRDRMPARYRAWEIHPSFMQHLPGVKTASSGVPAAVPCRDGLL